MDNFIHSLFFFGGEFVFFFRHMQKEKYVKIYINNKRKEKTLRMKQHGGFKFVSISFAFISFTVFTERSAVVFLSPAA
jgi:hypothetical protein